MKNFCLIMVNLVIFISLFAVIVTAQSDCTALANVSDCNFYSQCLEQRFRCGPNGFPLNYGNRYCRKFADELSCFTQEGQVWVNNTRNCLIQDLFMSDAYQQSFGLQRCNSLQTYAFSAYPSCYVTSGFCANILTSFTNLKCVSDVFIFNDAFNRLALQQVLDAAGQCTRDSANSFLSQVNQWINQANELDFKELLETLKDLLGGCRSGIDVVFVMDTSGSVGPNNFEVMKEFVKNVTSNFDIGPTQTRVGVIRFGSSVSEVIPLGSNDNETSLIASINNISYIGGGTNTHLALDLLRTAAFNNSRTNEGIPRVAIVLTDGHSNNHIATNQSAVLLHATGITVYAVGIGGGINRNELDIIATSSDNVFFISSFATFAEILLQLQVTACTTPQESSLGEELETSLGQDEKRLLEYPFPEEGMTLKINITTGLIQVYGSFSIRNPTSLTADFSISSTMGMIDYFISPDLYTSTSSINDNSDGNTIGKRQATETNSNATATNVYLSIEGLLANNVFTLNTTFGNTSIPIPAAAGTEPPVESNTTAVPTATVAITTTVTAVGTTPTAGTASTTPTDGVIIIGPTLMLLIFAALIAFIAVY